MERTKRLRSSTWVGPKSSLQRAGLHASVSSRTVLDLLSNQYAPIYDRICMYLPIDAICALVRTAKKFGHLQHDLRKTQWNIDVKLSRFVDHPKAFRAQMAANQALVSGSFAIQFFGRVVFTDSDLDVFIHSGEGAQAFERYLAEDEGYNTVRRIELNEYDGFPRFNDQVSTLTRKKPKALEETKIQIISTVYLPMKSILCEFYTTAVINVITWNKAYAIYPLQTFVRHKTYLTKQVNKVYGKLLAKYAKRGWEIRDVLWPEECPSNHGLSGLRRVGDKYTWVIPFNTNGIPPSKTPDSVIEYSAFEIQRLIPTELHKTHQYAVECSEFSSHVLRFKYLHPSLRVRSFWMAFAGQRLERLTELELYKTDQHALAETVVPGQFYYELAPQAINKPASWKFYDDEIPGWYKAYEQSTNKQATSGGTENAREEGTLLNS